MYIYLQFVFSVLKQTEMIASSVANFNFQKLFFK